MKRKIELFKIIVLAAFIVFTFAVNNAFGQNNLKTTGDGLVYKIIDNTSVTIIDYKGRLVEEPLIIPDKIEGLPVTEINKLGNTANSFTSIAIPETVTKIGAYAFDGFYLIKNINIPASVTTIEYDAFRGCRGLTSVNISSSVTKIGQGAFSNCSSLPAINVDNKNQAYISIDGVLFDKNIQTLIQYPAGKNLENYSIPETVTVIGEEAFYGCKKIKNVKINDNLTYIGSEAFMDCTSLTSIEIPKNTKLGIRPFSSCTNLQKIIVSSQNDYYTVIDDVLFDKKIEKLIQYPAGKNSETYIIPSTVTGIEWGAFQDCNNLKEVNIPSSVIYIEWYAFYGCRNLLSITIPPSVKRIGLMAFRWGGLKSVNISRNTYLQGSSTSSPFSGGVKINYTD